MYKMAQLILTPGRKASTTSEIFVTQPDAYKESLVGKLFVLVEIEARKTDGLKIINFLINNLNQNYYQNEKIYLREKISTLKVEHIFESALANTNKHLQKFLQNEKIKISKNSIHITVGVIYENYLHFVCIGNNKALLIYKDSTSDKVSQKAKYKISDITKQALAGDKKQINPEKLFSSVISGSIPKSGYFIFTNETLPEYLSDQQLIEIITTLPPVGAMEQIKNILLDVNAYVSFLGLVIKNITREEIPASEKPIKKQDTATGESVLTGLPSTEETTEKILTPSGIINFKKLLILPKRFISLFSFKRQLWGSSTFVLKDKIFIKRKPSFFSINKLFLYIKNFFVYLINIIFYLIKLLTDKDKLFNLITTGKNNFFKGINYLLLWFKGLNKKGKILFIIAIASILLLTQNLLLLDYKNKEIEHQQQYNDLIKLVEQKQNQVEANLLYSNDEGAKKLIEEIRELIVELPNETEEEKKQSADFNNLLIKQLEKIRRVTKITDQSELADFSALSNFARPQNLTLVQNNKIYAGDSSQKSIYILDTSDNLITTLTDLAQPIKNLEHSTLDKDFQIYYFNDDSILGLDTSNDELKTFDITLSGDPQGIVDIDNYNNRLYLLNNQANQIYRHDKSTNRFSQPTRWLKEELDLSQTVSMSIDGHIYLLQKNGEIIKLLRGKRIDLSLESVDPILGECTKLLVSPELKYIYILEPVNKRLVIFDKTGQFITQYQGDQFNDLKDFTIDENNEMVYFLNGTSVYGVKGIHFEK